MGNLPKDQDACPGFSPAQQLEVGMTDLEQPLKPCSTLAPVYPYLDCCVQEKQTSISCKSLNFDAACLLCEMIQVPSVPLPISLCQLAQYGVVERHCRSRQFCFWLWCASSEGSRSPQQPAEPTSAFLRSFVAKYLQRNTPQLTAP